MYKHHHIDWGVCNLVIYRIVVVAQDNRFGDYVLITIEDVIECTVTGVILVIEAVGILHFSKANIGCFSHFSKAKYATKSHFSKKRIKKGCPYIKGIIAAIRIFTLEI